MYLYLVFSIDAILYFFGMPDTYMHVIYDLPWDLNNKVKGQIAFILDVEETYDREKVRYSRFIRRISSTTNSPILYYRPLKVGVVYPTAAYTLSV